MKLAAVVPFKWFKAKTTEIKALMKKVPGKLGYRPADDIGYDLTLFCKKLQTEFDAMVALPQAREKLANRLSVYLKKQSDALAYLTPLSRLANLNDDLSTPDGYLRWWATHQCTEKVQEYLTSYEAAFKYAYVINEEAIEALVQRTLKKARAKPEVLASLSSDSFDDRILKTKYGFLASVGYEAAALRCMKREKQAFALEDLYDLMENLQRMLETWFSQTGMVNSDSFREFDFYGVKVVVREESLGNYDVRDYVKRLEEAYQRFARKGLKKAWYGTFFIDCAECGGANQVSGVAAGGVSAHYYIGKDYVRLYGPPNNSTPFYIAHELGHRYWFKFLTPEQRAHFTDLVKTHKERPRNITPQVFPIIKPAEVSQHKQWVLGTESRMNEFIGEVIAAEEAGRGRTSDLLRRFRNYVADIRSHYLGDNPVKHLSENPEVLKDPEVQHSIKAVIDPLDTLMVVLEGRKGDNEGLQQWADAMADGVFGFSTAAYILFDTVIEKHNEATMANAPQEAKDWQTSYGENTNPVEAVSGYGSLDIDEAFAEVFAYYIMDKSLDRDQLESFKAVMKLASLSPVVNRYLVAVGRP